MKLWIKLLASSVIGVILGILLPAGSAGPSETLDVMTRVFLNIGRYAVFPLVLFSLAMGTYTLKSSGKILRTYVQLFIGILLTSAGAVILGGLLVFVLTPARIPIIIEEGVVNAVPRLRDLLFQLFPKSVFQVLMHNGDFILPVCLLSVILGLTFEYDLNITEPVAAFFNSASRIFYWINSFIVEVISFLALILAVYFLFQIRAINDIDFFRELLIILGILSFFIIAVIYPLLIYILGGRKNPVKWLYAMLAPALVAFFSGDNYFSLAYLTKVGKESLGLPRRLNSAVFPIATVFARAGTAMVTCVSFVLILRSYSSLEIGFIQLLWVMAFSFLISFLLGAVPGLAPILALSALSSLYGRGMEEGFLILKPAAPFLISFAVLVDVFTAGFIGYIIGIREDMQTEIDSVEFA